MKITFAGVSRTGLVRERNEDAILMRACDDAALFLVADGVGGREHGEVVSGLLRDGYDAWWNERFLPNSALWGFAEASGEIKEVLFRQNSEVIRRFGEMKAGSTIVLLFLFRGSCLCLSSGDSRIYRVRGLSVRQITVDDVYENLQEKPMYANPDNNGKLVSAIGIRNALEYVARTDAARGGDRFFLCSDGTYRYFEPRKFKRMLLLGQGSSKRLVDRISAEVERGGARDNYSMIDVRISAV